MKKQTVISWIISYWAGFLFSGLLVDALIETSGRKMEKETIIADKSFRSLMQYLLMLQGQE